MSLIGNLFSHFKARNSNNFNIISEDRIQTEGGIEGGEIDALKLDIKDEDLIKISREYIKNWAEYYGKGLKDVQDLNKAYWAGNQSRDYDDDPYNNVIFEALETYLPIVTKQYPQPIVTITGDESGEQLSKILQKYLYYLSNELDLRAKISQCERYRKLNLLGVIKVGWNISEDEISCKAIDTRNLILDPDAEIDCGYYKGEYLGEYKCDTAESLIAKIPEQKDYISNEVKDKLGTKITYIEWYGKTMNWIQYKDKVLTKYKNPNWNYYEEENEKTDDEEVKIKWEKENNFFPEPRIPYIFHTVYNMGHPHDETSDITQSIPLQDIVNKRLRQIDFNADNANGGLIISGDYYDEEQGAEVAQSLRDGGVVWQKRGKPSEGVFRDTGRPLTGEIFQHLTYSEQAIRNIIGVSGSSAQALSNETTVRGKIISSEKDGSRSATSTMYLEILYKNIYKWFMQLIYVFYTEEKKVSIQGEDKVQEELIIYKTKLRKVKAKISVKDGSMIPKDPVTKRNEAIDLWTAGAIDPITMFDRLDFDNPRELAQRVIQYQNDPIGYLQSDNIDTTVKRMAVKELMEKQQANAGGNMGIGKGGNSEGKQKINPIEKAGTNQKLTSQGNKKQSTGVNYESKENILNQVGINK